MPEVGQQNRLQRKKLGLFSGQQPTEKPNTPSPASDIPRAGSAQRPVRILAFIEALRPTTGPAKNLLEFAGRAAAPPGPLPSATIAVATYRRGNEPAENDFVVACQRAGLEINIIHERFLFDLAVIPAIRKLIELYQPDIIQTHAVKSHFLVRLAGINRGRPWIAFHHGYTWTSRRTCIYNELDRWSLRAPNKVVTVCRSFACALEQIGVRPERILVRHNSVKAFSPASAETVRQLRQTLGIAEGSRVILCVGRLSREKAQQDFVEAAALIRSNNCKRKVRFVIAGDGPDRLKLKDLAKSRGVEDWIVFSGQVANLAPYYTMADIAVLPSHSEGSPNVLLEAMAGGLPIVATAVGGIPEIVEHEKQALLVEKHDPAALARSIERLLDDPALCMRLAASARQGISAYTPDAYRDSILSLYQSCLAGRPESPNAH
jgi:glycosyltransferase involved in cell wall biosynthesis